MKLKFQKQLKSQNTWLAVALIAAAAAPYVYAGDPAQDLVGAASQLDMSGVKAISARGASSAAESASSPRQQKKSVNLSDYEGKMTFLQLMTAPDGLKTDIDDAEAAQFQIAAKDDVHAAAQNFDPSVVEKITALFKTGQDGFDQLIDSLAGQSVTPANVKVAIGQKLRSLDLLGDASKTPLDAVIISPFLSIASGGGVELRINDSDTTYHFGFAQGFKTDPRELSSAQQTELKADVKSGRSFASSAGHKALDPSDVYYLNELEEYLQSEPEQSTMFFQAILQALTRCDGSGFDRLSSQGQTVAADFLAIYTAELDRNLMADLKEHPWEDDLAEVTFLSAFVVKAAGTPKLKSLGFTKPKDFFGVGPTGSGIGETRQARREMQTAVTNAEREAHPDVVSPVNKLIGQSDGDVIRGLLSYLNDPDKQDDVKANSAALVSAFTDFMTQVQADADTIAADLPSTISKPAGRSR